MTGNKGEWNPLKVGQLGDHNHALMQVKIMCYTDSH
jgi:hypothetical protein